MRRETVEGEHKIKRAKINKNGGGKDRLKEETNSKRKKERENGIDKGNH